MATIHCYLYVFPCFCLILFLWSQPSSMTFMFDDKLYYPIPTYNGSRELEFYSRNAILYGNASLLTWPTLMDVGEENSLYFADRNANILKKITSDGKIFVIAGQMNTKGFRNGDLKNTLFNNSFNLAYFNPSYTQQIIANSTFPIILLNTSMQCLNVNFTNYTICQDNNTNNTLINNTSLIKEILNKTLYNELLNKTTNNATFSSLISGPVLFVADKDNHCIRLIDLNQRISTTYAGICQTPGFQDGPLGQNLFRFPESLGVDVFGNVFVYDSGNKYVRMIKNDGCVVTLVPGACRKDMRYQPKALPKYNLINDYVTCYKQWMNSTAGDSICSSGNDSNFCYDEIFQCVTETSPFIYRNTSN